ncbi:MAG: hypothetical protein WBM55_13670, partial [Muriicola sp.]
GYNCGAALGAKLSVGFPALQEKLTSAKASPGCFALRPVPCFIKNKDFCFTKKEALNYRRC